MELITEQDELPQTLQIEPTTNCNLHCSICTHSCLVEGYKNLSMTTYTKIAHESFSKLQKLLFMGIGEPLMHPNFIDMLKIAREHLKSNAEIEFTTNASLLSPNVADEIINYDISRIIVSIDTPFFSKLSRFRKGISENLKANIEYLAELYTSQQLTSLIFEMVITSENYVDLIDMIEYCNSIGVEGLVVSHLLPHSTEMVKKTLYSPLSFNMKELAQNISKESWQLAKKMIFDPNHFYLASADLIRNDIFQSREQGMDINPTGIYENNKKSGILTLIEEKFMEAQRFAESVNIKIDLPPIFPTLENRFCPYIKQKACVINVDGDVIPCYNYIHSIENFVNNHKRIENKYVLGNINSNSLSEIWFSQKYQNFRKVLKNMPNNVPFCGNCPFSYLDCFFTQNNNSDCWGNQPGCHECLYSLNLIKCLIDSSIFN